MKKNMKNIIFNVGVFIVTLLCTLGVAFCLSKGTGVSMLDPKLYVNTIVEVPLILLLTQILFYPTLFIVNIYLKTIGLEPIKLNKN